MAIAAAEPLETGCLYARSILNLRAECHAGKSSFDAGFYLSGYQPGELTGLKALKLIRGHWGGVATTGAATPAWGRIGRALSA